MIYIERPKVSYFLFFLLIAGLIMVGNPVRAQYQPAPGEGLYKPESITLPSAVRSVIPSIVRIDSKLRFRIRIFSSPSQVKEFNKNPENREKIFRDTGDVIWTSAIDSATVNQLCKNPMLSAKPGNYEVCQTLSKNPCQTYPCTRTTMRLKGGASGVAIAKLPNGRTIVATNYHVMREAIERFGRTEGVQDFSPIDTKGYQVRIFEQINHKPNLKKKLTKNIQLLANASTEQWKKGKDWALFSLPPVASLTSSLPPLAEERPEPGDTLYAIGFPIRTVRKLPDSAHYSNASANMRVSVGTVVNPDSVTSAQVKTSDIISTLDAAPGNSGSAILNREGQVVGILRDHTSPKGSAEQALVEYGGYSLIVPVGIIQKVLQVNGL